MLIRCCAVLILLWTISAWGCFSFSRGKARNGADSAAAERVAWPAREETALRSILDATPERVFTARMIEGRRAEDVTKEALRAMVERPRWTVTRKEIVEGTLVRMIRNETAEISLDTLFMGFEPNGYVLTARDLAPGNRRLELARAEHSRKTINAVWARHGMESSPVAEDIALDSGVAFSVPPEAPANCRGVVLHLWALANNPYEHKVMQAMAAQGWLIVHIKLKTGAPAETPEAAVDRIMALDDELTTVASELPSMNKGESFGVFRKRLEASPAYRRQTDIVKEMMELRNPAIQLCTGEDVPRAAAALGARIDAVLADNAAAAAAVLETTYRLHPSLRGRPMVVMGFSAGAISTPTVAARLLPDAVVIIGGAANAVAISARSEVSRGGLRLVCDGRPPAPALVRKLETEYLAHSKLDPYHMAPLLANVPVLVVDAGMDTWVPSEFGEVLYDRLGRPDRLHMALGGHGMLFYFLPGQAAWISAWVGKAAGANTR